MPVETSPDSTVLARRGGVFARAFAACMLAAVMASCGGGAGRTSEQPLRGSRLAVFASVPLHGPGRAVGEDVLRGQQLALEQDGGRVGRYRVHLAALDAVRPQKDGWDPAQVSQNARRAARDPRTIAYIGEVRTGASAISIPILNEAGILQVSPLDTALGLTRHSFAITGSPERYYPNAQRVGRTFARLVPSDRVQAAVLLAAMAELGARRLALLTDDDAPGLALASAVRGKAREHGVSIVASEQVDEHVQDHRDLVTKVLARRPDAVLYAGGAQTAAVPLWHELTAADPALRLFAPEALADASFLAGIRAVRAMTYVTRPVVVLGAYPLAAQRFARAFSHRYGNAPLPQALYGYEAMRAVLAAIRRAEHDADGSSLTRRDVVRAFFAAGTHESVLGRYTIDKHGDTSLRRWGIYHVVGGRLQFQRALDG